MVCVPCFIIPALLFLWHKLIQPYVLRYWNPWAVRQPDGSEQPPPPLFKCGAGVCTLRAAAAPPADTADTADTSAGPTQTPLKPKAE